MKRRLQFDFTPGAVEQLDALQERLGASTRAEVVRKALALLDHTVQAQEKGGALVVRTPDGREKELVFI